MEMGVIYRDSATLIATAMMESGNAKKCKPPVVHRTKGMVQKWWVDVMRLAQVVPGQNKYLVTPIGNVPLYGKELIFELAFGKRNFTILANLP
jgi:hypothetical protein